MASYAESSSTSTAVGGDELPVEVYNAQEVQRRITAAAEAAGRSASDVQLVCVSKTKPVEAIQRLYDAGFRRFGENYFQELVEKAAALPYEDIQWHFIGHLQSAKAPKIVREVPHLALIETVDSEKLARKLNNACAACEPPLRLGVYLQVDTSGEATKSGVAANSEELLALVTVVKEECPHLDLKGLMTIGAPGDLTCFDRLVESRLLVARHLAAGAEDVEAAAAALEPQLALSMGMSGDFEAAIARGATSVRVGSTIFGARVYPNKPPADTA